MATLNRIRVTWDSDVPGGGLSTFYYPSSQTDVSDLKTFFTSVAAYLPAGLSLTVPSNGDQVDSNSGRITGGWTGTGGGTVTGGGNSNWSNGIGLRVVWETVVVRNGRRVRGSTFICPLGQGFAANDGTLNNTTKDDILGFANTLANTGFLNVFHRPPKGTFTGGATATVSSASVPDRVTALRSRRY